MQEEFTFGKDENLYYLYILYFIYIPKYRKIYNKIKLTKESGWFRVRCIGGWGFWGGCLYRTGL